jgi:hypothetical protein
MSALELSFTFEVEMGNVCGKFYQPARSSETKDKKEKCTLVRQTTLYPVFVFNPSDPLMSFTDTDTD